MKSTIISLAFAGAAVAQAGYGQAPPAYAQPSSSSSSSSSSTSSSCTETSTSAPGYGPPAYVSTSSSSSSSSSTSSSTSSSVTKPAGYGPPGYASSSSSSSSSMTYPCNPAHQYPAGQYCTEVSGSLTLVTSTTVPAYGYPTKSSSASTTTTYACNPAHSYPNGASCISTSGTLSLVTPSATKPAYYPTSSATGECSKEGKCYDAYNVCRVKPDSNKATCASEFASCLGYNPFSGEGTNTVTKGCSSASTTESKTYPTAPVYTTKVVSEYTTYCPEPTTFTHGQTTYTVTKATTITLPCKGGCTVTEPVKPTSYPVPSYTKPWANTTVPVYPTAPVYTTETVSSYTTYCPKPTTFTHEQSTYTITKATTVTLPCKGGCVVTKPVTYTTKTVEQPPVYTTETVTDSLTTYCPTPTTLTHKATTYVVTTATTLTLPCDGGCTVTKPVSPPVYSMTTEIVTPIYSVPTYAPSFTASSSVPVAPAPEYSAPPAAPHYPVSSSASVGTVNVPSATYPVSPVAETTAPITPYTGGAAKVGASFAAVVGVAAVFFL